MLFPWHGMPPFINTEKVRMRPLYARSIERQPHPKIPGKQKKKEKKEEFLKITKILIRKGGRAYHSFSFTFTVDFLIHFNLLLLKKWGPIP